MVIFNFLEGGGLIWQIRKRADEAGLETGKDMLELAEWAAEHEVAIEVVAVTIDKI